MARVHTVVESIVIGVDPMVAYEAVSDPTNMGRWSPENTGAKVRKRGRPLAVGDHFVGHNKRGPGRWSTRCTVTAAEPGRRFAFDVDRFGVGMPVLPVRIASWAYDFEPDPEGTLVTETWTDGRDWMPERTVPFFDWIATGGSTFATMHETNMRATLRHLKAELET